MKSIIYLFCLLFILTADLSLKALSMITYATDGIELVSEFEGEQKEKESKDKFEKEILPNHFSDHDQIYWDNIVNNKSNFGKQSLKEFVKETPQPPPDL